MSNDNGWITESAELAWHALSRIGWLLSQLVSEDSRERVYEQLRRGRSDPEQVSRWYESVWEKAADDREGPALVGAATKQGFHQSFGHWWFHTIAGATLLDEFGELARRIGERASPCKSVSHGLVGIDEHVCGKSHFESIAKILGRIESLAESAESGGLIGFCSRLPLARLHEGVGLEKQLAMERHGRNAAEHEEVDEPWIPIDEAAELAGVSKFTVRRWSKAKRDPMPLQRAEGGQPLRPFLARVSDVRAWAGKAAQRASRSHGKMPQQEPQ